MKKRLFSLWDACDIFWISLDGLGEFTGDELIEQVEKSTPAGDAAIRMELIFIRKMPSISKRIAQDV